MIPVQRRLSQLVHDRHALLLGVMLSLALIAMLLTFSSSHVLATGESAAAGVPNWIGQLGQEQLTASRQRAQQKLEESGEAAVDPLIAALHSTNPVLRRNSAEMLGYMSSPRAMLPLIERLQNDPDASVRREAVKSLGAFDDAELTSTIRRAAIFDQDSTVRQAAVDALSAVRLNLAAHAGKNGRIVSAFAVAPKETQIVYLAEMGDISISRDGGKSWQSAGSLPSRVATLEVSALDSDMVYAGTEALGFFKSADGGKTWQASNMGLGVEPGITLSVTAISGDPQDADRLFAAAAIWVGTSKRELYPKAVYSSSDGGVTWQELPSSATTDAITLLWFQDNVLYALAGEGVVTIPL